MSAVISYNVVKNVSNMFQYTNVLSFFLNDADHMSKEEIIDNQVHLVDIATKMFPEKKVILSGITPRNDDLDHVVQ
jgi:hypothetical protein